MNTSKSEIGKTVYLVHYDTELNKGITAHKVADCDLEDKHFRNYYIIGYGWYYKKDVYHSLKEAKKVYSKWIQDHLTALKKEYIEKEGKLVDVLLKLNDYKPKVENLVTVVNVLEEKSKK